MEISIEVDIFTKDNTLSYATEQAASVIFRRLRLNLSDFLGGKDMSSFFPTSNPDYESDRKMKSHEQNIIHRETKSKNRYILKIFTNDPIFYFMEYGTGLFVESGGGRPGQGVIRAQKGKVLRFEIDGEIIYTPYISGSQPVPMFRSALFKLRNLDIKKILRSMGIKYRSKIASDGETVLIEIIGLYERHEKFGRIEGPEEWQSKVGSKIKSIMKLLLGK